VITSQEGNDIFTLIAISHADIKRSEPRKAGPKPQSAEDPITWVFQYQRPKVPGAPVGRETREQLEGL
jgi:hypothetical protein